MGQCPFTLDPDPRGSCGLAGWMGWDGMESFTGCSKLDNHTQQPQQQRQQQQDPCFVISEDSSERGTRYEVICMLFVIFEDGSESRAH